jgi:hypothetical protein
MYDYVPEFIPGMMIQIDPNSMGLKLAQRQRFPSIPGRN